MQGWKCWPGFCVSGNLKCGLARKYFMAEHNFFLSIAPAQLITLIFQLNCYPRSAKSSLSNHSVSRFWFWRWKVQDDLQWNYVTKSGRLSFLPCTHIHSTQEILRRTGNLDRYFQKVTGFDKSLIWFNWNCLIQWYKGDILAFYCFSVHVCRVDLKHLP